MERCRPQTMLQNLKRLLLKDLRREAITCCSTDLVVMLTPPALFGAEEIDDKPRDRCQGKLPRTNNITSSSHTLRNDKRSPNGVLSRARQVIGFHHPSYRGQLIIHVTTNQRDPSPACHSVSACRQNTLPSSSDP